MSRDLEDRPLLRWAQRRSRGLAHATRPIVDPRQIYPVLGPLSTAAASSARPPQVASSHEGHAQNTSWVSNDSQRDEPRLTSCRGSYIAPVKILRRVTVHRPSA